MKGGFIRRLGQRGLQKLKWVIALLILTPLLPPHLEKQSKGQC